MSSSPNKDFYFGAAATVATIVGLLYYRNQRKTVKNSTEKSNAPVTTSNRTINIPVIDFAAFFSQDKDPARYQDECNKVAEALHNYGLVILRDPRVSEADNNRFLSMMENYFGLSDGIRDARPQYHYQVGVTPENVERPRDHAQRISSYGEQDKPLSSAVPTKDPKWRFFWRVGPRPEVTEFPSQNMDDVVPPEFPEWKEVMDMWGGKMTDALFTLAEMAAVGFNMEKDTFTKRMMFGSHLLAPTGSNYNKYNEEGTVLAGFHYDLNFLTIHGKSRFPGLYVWTREGVKTPVSVPDGCLIVQAGKQIEYLTGGHVLAGFHEVVINAATIKVIESKKAKGESLWRVSSTCFGHIQSDQVLEPLPPFDSAEAKRAFPPIKTGHQVLKELESIALAKTSNN